MEHRVTRICPPRQSIKDVEIDCLHASDQSQVLQPCPMAEFLWNEALIDEH